MPALLSVTKNNTNNQPPAITGGFSVSTKVLIFFGTHRCVFGSFVTDWQKLRVSVPSSCEQFQHDWVAECDLGVR